MTRDWADEAAEKRFGFRRFQLKDIATALRQARADGYKRGQEDMCARIIKILPLMSDKDAINEIAIEEEPKS